MVDLTEQSFKISDRKIWHPLQADSLTEDQEGETREELLDKSDALLIEKLPSLQNGSPRYDTTGLTRKLAVDLKVLCIPSFLNFYPRWLTVLIASEVCNIQICFVI